MLSAVFLEDLTLDKWYWSLLAHRIYGISIVFLVLLTMAVLEFSWWSSIIIVSFLVFRNVLYAVRHGKFFPGGLEVLAASVAMPLCMFKKNLMAGGLCVHFSICVTGLLEELFQLTGSIKKLLFERGSQRHNVFFISSLFVSGWIFLAAFPFIAHPAMSALVYMAAFISLFFVHVELKRYSPRDTIEPTTCWACFMVFCIINYLLWHFFNNKHLILFTTHAFASFLIAIIAEGIRDSIVPVRRLTTLRWNTYNDYGRSSNHLLPKFCLLHAISYAGQYNEYLGMAITGFLVLQIVGAAIEVVSEIEHNVSRESKYDGLQNKESAQMILFFACALSSLYGYYSNDAGLAIFVAIFLATFLWFTVTKEAYWCLLLMPVLATFYRYAFLYLNSFQGYLVWLFAIGALFILAIFIQDFIREKVKAEAARLELEQPVHYRKAYKMLSLFFLRNDLENNSKKRFKN